MSFGDSRIDLFQQIKEFDYLCIATLPGVTGNYRSVYFALLSINNSRFWAPVFEVDFQYTLELSRVDKDTYRRAMDFFNENGLFDSYEKGVNKWARARVSLKVLHEKPTGNTVSNGVSSADANTTCNNGGSTASNAHFNKTLNDKTPKQEKLEITIDQLNFIEPEFDVVFKKWLIYKKDRRENYKSVDTIKVCYNKLKRECNNDAEVAKIMIENSIASGYKGFFPLKNDNLQQAPRQSKSAAIINANQHAKEFFSNQALVNSI